MNKQTTPNAEQLQALRDYADCYGKGWKQVLSTDWMRGGTTCYPVKDRYHLLHQLRNQLGPSWLATFEFEG